ncbi:Lrp/AsnC family transcriptional regulator [Thalassiella azotivora]
MTRIDAIDARLLLALDEDPSASTLALSRSLGLARNTVHAHLSRLEGGRALGPVSQRVNLPALGYPLLAFVSLQISQGDIEEIAGALERIPEVLELYAVTGDADVVARVVARDPEDLHRVTRVMLQSPGVERTSTVLAVRELVAHRAGPLLERLLRQGSGRDHRP